jgi:shikimate kinase
MKNAASSIFLIGMPGSGKTTIGKSLARSLRRPFVDLDHQIEQRCGVRIPVIFEIEGEQGFRRRESQVLAEVAQEDGLVLATGGGAILAEENRQILASRGWVIYLRASVDDLVLRTSKDRNRPLLATQNPRARLEQLMAERVPLYEALADLVIDTGATSVSALGQQVAQQVRQLQEQT